jgi:hypothetical protein
VNESALDYLNNREVALGGYVSHITMFQPRDSSRPPMPVLLYVATSSNQHWLGTASTEHIANQVKSSQGCVIVALQGCVVVELQDCVIVGLQGFVIVGLQGCVIVALQGCVIVALQGCVIVVLQGCVATSSNQHWLGTASTEHIANQVKSSPVAKAQVILNGNATITQPCNATQQSRNHATPQSRNLSTQQSRNLAMQQ